MREYGRTSDTPATLDRLLRKARRRRRELRICYEVRRGGYGIQRQLSAIRNLKARYAALCDKQYDADGIAMLFTEDAQWESPGLGRFEGREAIRGFFQKASGVFSFAIHYSLNGHIEVEGDTARARWYLFMPCTVTAGNQAMWRASIDHEIYVRADGV
jgi:ketosteroid isomerase-like protein